MFRKVSNSIWHHHSTLAMDTLLAYVVCMNILATQTFMRNIEGELDDLEFWKLQDYVCEQPECGKLIPHASGLRKLRWGTGDKGKRGGLRVIYYYKVGDTILFVAAYRKSKQEDLTLKQLKKLVKLIEEE